MAPMVKMYQLSKFSLGKARSRAPIIMGRRKLPKHGRHHRHEEEPHHDDAVGREQLVVGVGRHQVARRRHQIEADHRRGRAAQEEHEGHGDKYRMAMRL